MKNATRYFASISFLALLVPSSINAQNYTGYSELSVLLKADTNSKSVLVSNLFETRAGDQSPFIGTANWFDKGRQLQCRSLLSFDYGILPALISPDQITSAQLILNPLQLENAVAATDSKNAGFIVRRVLQPWEDSLTTWTNQPLAYKNNEVTKQVPARKKDRSVKVDVTHLVKDMFKYGNNGFLICNEDSLKKITSSSQWFASAKNTNPEIRPVLIINYASPYNFSQSQSRLDQPLPLTAKDKQELMQNYFRPEPVTSTPPPEPVKNEPVKNE